MTPAPVDAAKASPQAARLAVAPDGGRAGAPPGGAAAPGPAAAPVDPVAGGGAREDDRADEGTGDPTDDRADVQAAVAAHDAAVAARGLALWLGGEPTYTRRESLEPAWLGAALGSDKEARARALLRALAAPGDLVLRTVGRQYPGEDRPRFSYGRYRRRDGAPALAGAAQDALEGGLDDAPDDALEGGTAATAGAGGGRDAPAGAQAARAALVAGLVADGVAAVPIDAPGPLPWRAAWRDPAATARGPFDPDDPRLLRAPLGGAPLPEAGLADDLAADGVALVALGDLPPAAPGGPARLRVELPQVRDVPAFLALVARVARAAAGPPKGDGAPPPELVWTGFPPPADAAVAWLTVTPDPGVVEVNMAPAPDLAGYLRAREEVDRAAAAAGLSPWRARYTGEVSDSGGGGQLTFGGPTPRESPFLRHPRLLPQLLAYLNRHPALAYAFAVECVGGSSQSPRTDEGAREAWEELPLALALLAHGPPPGPEALWATLQPFCADRFGNTHRAEVNLEKLWNPDLPGRGRLGLVELRALRMARDPARGAAVAALFRALVAWLATRAGPPDVGLVDWGPVLHDRFALPSALAADVEEVLADLEAAGLGLAPALARRVRAAVLEDRLVGELEDGQAGDGPGAGRVALVVRRAVEHWPLVGDAHAQERGTARWVDASTERYEVALEARAGGGGGRGPCSPAGMGTGTGTGTGRVGGREAVDAGGRGPCPTAGAGSVDGREAVDVLGPRGWVALPLMPLAGAGTARVVGVRRRAFAPAPGLHPTLPAQGPLTLRWRRPDGRAWRVVVHPWRPDGGAYDGLPADLDEAARRRAARFVATPLAGPGPGAGPDAAPDAVPDAAAPATAPPPGAATAWTLDLRRLWALAQSAPPAPGEAS